MKTIITPIIFIFFLITLQTSYSAEHSKYALVLGNDTYTGIASLKNAANDARLISHTLKKIGFHVQEVYNADYFSFQNAIKEFSSRLRNAPDRPVGLFYYAGHGIQLEGENYLVPVDAKLNHEKDVYTETINVKTFLQAINLQGKSLNIVILDACRNNPFKSRTRDINRGLAAIVNAPSGTLVAFSTSPGDVALDGKSENSPYSFFLSKYMLEKGISVEKMFKLVRRSVMEGTTGQQIPWETSSLTGDFYFGADGPGTQNINPAFDKEILFWKSISASSSVSDYEAYLLTFPNGVFRNLAIQRIKDLSERKTSPSSGKQAKGRWVKNKDGSVSFVKE